ncbi:MAG: GMC family oxidoreductase [Deltaproteobacteria bacterium]|nr:GMC family oxidoreductase [Deltaproteobacteria bacterium]
MSLPASVSGVLGNTSLDRFDALIVGSGAGGSAAAHVLAAAGWKVLVLEAGVNPFPGLDHSGHIPWPLFSNDEIKNALRHFVYQDPLLEPRTFRQSESETAQAHPDVNILTRNVGGAAVISGVAYPRFTPVDFRMASALSAAGRNYPGTSFADWPLSYEELEPFYTEAECLSGVAGDTTGEDDNPFAPPRSRPLPLPPQPPMYVARVLAHGAKQLGYHPYNLESAINTQPYDGRSPCVSCGFCSGYGCPRNAKGSPAVTTLRRALLTGNCQLRYHAHVSRLVRDGSGRRVVSVEYIDDNGQMQSAAADHVILAASPIESARICWLSGITDAGGHLGRHMMFHFQTTGVGIFKQRLHGERGRSVTHVISDFRGVKAGGAELRSDWPHLAGVVEFGTSSQPIIAARESLRPEAVGFARLFNVSFKQLLVESPFHAHIAVLIMQGEDAPQPANRVDLDPTVRDVFGLPVPRLTYRNHAFELNASEFYKPKMLELLEAAGAAYGFFQPFDPAVPPASRHILGGLRMGTSPADSVCDRFGKFHDLDNLYCADGGVFVTGSGYNPTLTIIALALRLAGALVSPGSPEHVLGCASAAG